MKYIKERSEFNCDYFDMSMVEDYYPYTIKPIYGLIAKREKHELVYMSPKEYLETIAKNFGMSYEDTINGGAVNQEAVDKYATAMKSGDKFPVGYYKVDKPLQEGRHRALAALKLGCESMPVVKITTDVPMSEVMDFVIDNKDKTFEELNDMFPNGITRLDWNELQSFIKYRLED